MPRVFRNVDEFDLNEIDTDTRTDFLLVEPSPVAFRWIPKGSGRTVVWLVDHPEATNLPAALQSNKIDANVLLCDVTSPFGEVASNAINHSEFLATCFHIIFRICGSKRCIVVAGGDIALSAIAVGRTLPKATTVLFSPSPEHFPPAGELVSSRQRDVDNPPRILSIWDAPAHHDSQSERFIESLPLNIDEHSVALERAVRITMATQLEIVGAAIKFPEWNDLCSAVNDYAYSFGSGLQPNDKEFPIQTLELDLLGSSYAFEVFLVSDVDLYAKDLAVVVDFEGWSNPPLGQFKPSLRWSRGLGKHFYYLGDTPANEQQEILSFSGKASCGRIAVSVLRWDIDASKSCNLDLEFTLTTAN